MIVFLAFACAEKTRPVHTALPTATCDRGVIEKLEERDDSLYFRAPVKRNTYPNYYTKIKKPMDLRTIQTKITQFE